MSDLSEAGKRADDWNREHPDEATEHTRRLAAGVEAAMTRQPSTRTAEPRTDWLHEEVDDLTLLDRAEQAITDLCSGKRKWTMTVPPDVMDQDLILSEVTKRMRSRIEAEAADLRVPDEDGCLFRCDGDNGHDGAHFFWYDGPHPIGPLEGEGLAPAGLDVCSNCGEPIGCWFCRTEQPQAPFAERLAAAIDSVWDEAAEADEALVSVQNGSAVQLRPSPKLAERIAAEYARLRQPTGPQEPEDEDA